MIQHTMIINQGGQWGLVQNANTPFQFTMDEITGLTRASVTVNHNGYRQEVWAYGSHHFRAMSALAAMVQDFQAMSVIDHITALLDARPNTR